MLAATTSWDKLGLRQTATGCSILLGDSCAVHRQKTAQATTCLAGVVAEAVCTGGATRCYRPAYAVRMFDRDLGNMATLFIIMMTIYIKWIRDMEYCGGRGEAPACGVFCMAMRARRRSNSGCGEAPARLCLCGATARQPARGPDSVVSLCQMVFGGAAALRRQVLHSGGLLGVVRSVFLDFLSTLDRVLTATS